MIPEAIHMYNEERALEILNKLVNINEYGIFLLGKSLEDH